MGINDIGKEKQRGKEIRKRKPVLLIAAEGKNKTEIIYLKRFGPYSKYALNFDNNTYTDPENLIKSLIRKTKEKGLSLRYGDRAVCVFDTDTQTHNKQQQIDNALLYRNDIVETVISSPCIEVWFLCHYFYSTKEYASNEKVIAQLQKIIPDYSKRKDIFDTLYPNTKTAIKNAKELEKYHIAQQHKMNSYESNPSSQFYRLIERIWIESGEREIFL